MTIPVAMTVNGKPASGKVEARTLLVQFLREHLGMTGTHVGCDTSQCGACVVHVDGKSVKSCTMLAVQAEGAKVLTIEGLAESAEKLHPMQEAFRENHALQCGFCTPGMVMSAIDMVKRHNYQLDEATVRRELEGNLCRCTGYHNIVKAILAAVMSTTCRSHARPTRTSCARRMLTPRSRASTPRPPRRCRAWSRSSPARTSPTPRSAA
jgi:aerobic carbon-monoxide dehydrogenase small subunit